ncbi:MAG TPA: type II toxin-antitoxin system death-on-curing family toxin [Flavobacteriales bacterium]|nr:type II toxin-antitoxin system death-on-curing family toxin [Flavobacteriales bacterium]
MIGLEEALAIHREVVAATGGSHGVRDMGGLESALFRPYASFGGVGLYPDAVDKAAALLESIVKNHPFLDGNKRAGYMLMRLTLRTYGLDLQAEDEEEYALIIQVATGNLDVDGIRAWFAGRARPCPQR